MEMWFSVFTTDETMAAQLLTVILVVGSYYGARQMLQRRPANSRVFANERASSGISPDAVY